MQSVKLATLLAVPAILVGCGGSESSPSSPPKYTINFLTLSQVSSNNVGNCAIYGQDDVDNPTKFVVADRNNATPNDVLVYIHDQNGKVTQEPFDSTDWPNGSISFNQDNVEPLGYISIVSSGRGGIYDILTIEKSLIPTSFSVNALSSTVTNPTSTCITQSRSNENDYTGFINPVDATDGKFAFRSTIESKYSISPLPDGINFKAIANSDVLAARYCRDSALSCTPGELLEYQFTNVNNLGSASNPIDLEPLTSRATWTPDLSLDTTIDNAALTVNRSDLITLPWQELPTDKATDFTYADALETSYYLTIDGAYKTWDVSYVAQIDNPSTGIDESTTLSDLNLSAATDINSALEANCHASEVGYCINGYSASTIPTTFDYQRTLVYATSGNKVHQTIYGTSKKEQPLMSFSDQKIDAIWGNTLTKLEIAVVDSNDEQKVREHFISSFSNSYELFNNGYLTTSGMDTIFVAKSSAVLQDERARLEHTPHMLLNNEQINP